MIYIDPAIDETVRVVYRDRERSVPRYNQFRRGLLMIPISKWEDLTDDEEALQTLREVYGEDVEKLDLLVGLMAEKKIKGFAISETAFFIFIIMASRYIYIYIHTHIHTQSCSSFSCKIIYIHDTSIINYRRLEADRFFTSYFNEETYTKKGFQWVNSTESLRDVIQRHYPNIVSTWMNSTSAFSVWDAPPNSFNPVPLLLRFPS